MPAPCNEKIALLFEYTNAAKRYCDAVTELHDKIAIATHARYDELHRIAEDARRNTEKARLAMDDHVKKHGC